MTIDEVLGPVMVPLAYAAAVAAALWMLLRLARRYPSAPKRIPLIVGWDGRPSSRTVGKWILWLAPAILTAVLVGLGLSVFVLLKAPTDSGTILALTFVVCAEVAYLVVWSADRQVELARKMTYRISPARSLRVALPMLLTLAVLLFVAARP